MRRLLRAENRLCAMHAQASSSTSTPWRAQNTPKYTLSRPLKFSPARSASIADATPDVRSSAMISSAARGSAPGPRSRMSNSMVRYASSLDLTVVRRVWSHVQGWTIACSWEVRRLWRVSRSSVRLVLRLRSSSSCGMAVSSCCERSVI